MSEPVERAIASRRRILPQSSLAFCGRRRLCRADAEHRRERTIVCGCSGSLLRLSALGCRLLQGALLEQARGLGEPTFCCLAKVASEAYICLLYIYIYICIYTHIIIETCLFIYIYPDSYSQARGAALPCPQRWPCRPVQSSSRQRMPMRSGCAKLLNTSARADIFSRSSRTWRSPSSSAQHSKRVSAVCPGAWSPTSLQAGWPRTKAMEIHLRYAGEPLCQEGEAGA